VENEFPNDTKEEEQLTEGSEPYFPLPAFPQDDIWPELLEKIISYSKKNKTTQHTAPGRPPACRPSYTHRGEKGDENLPPGKGGSNGSPSKGSDECGR
jgi:hypothetical protein